MPEKRNGGKDDKTPRPLRLIKTDSVEGELLSSVAVGSVAQIVVAIAATLGICYGAKVPLVTLLVAVLITFILAPIVDLLQRWKLPRWAGSFIAVGILVACCYGVAAVSYTQAVDFIDDLPKYSDNIRKATTGFRQQAEKIERTTQSVLPSSDEPNTVKVTQSGGVTKWISESGITDLLLAISFIPFLVYFMLSWMERMRDSTVKLFDPEHRRNVQKTLVGIADMLRAYIVGNLICGVFMSMVSTALFWYLHLPFFYFLGVISGFLSLIPYLGVILAIVPPLATGIGSLSNTEMFTIAAVIVGLHVFAINVLFPKVIGRRLKLNPLVVTVALLGWGWIWGAPGLILAIPITGAMKIIFDHVPSLRPVGAWMEE